jgi:hypothetical protein
LPEGEVVDFDVKADLYGLADKTAKFLPGISNSGILSLLLMRNSFCRSGVNCFLHRPRQDSRADDTFHSQRA